MTTPSLSSVASNVVGQYALMSKLIVDTYRSGAQRLIGGATTRYADFLNSRALPMLNNDVKASLINAQAKVTGLVEDGIKLGSDRAGQAIDFVAGGVHDGIQRVAATTDKIEGALKTQALSNVGHKAILPLAQVSLEIATRALDGTKRLSARVVGAHAEVAQVKRVVKAKTKAVAQSAAKTSAGAKRVVKKAVSRTKARA